MATVIDNKEDGKTIVCSFCGRDSNEIGVLIGSTQTGAKICWECVEEMYTNLEPVLELLHSTKALKDSQDGVCKQEGCEHNDCEKHPDFVATTQGDC